MSAYMSEDQWFAERSQQIQSLNSDWVLVNGSPFGPNGYSIRSIKANDFYQTEMSSVDVGKFVRDRQKDKLIQSVSTLVLSQD